GGLGPLERLARPACRPAAIRSEPRDVEVAVRRALFVLALTFTIVVGTATPIAADDQYTVPQGAVTWSVDRDAQTITVSVRLQVFAACESCPWAGTSGGQVLENQFLVD